jgi:chromosome segregation ATPase
MATEKTQAAIEETQAKIDKLSNELAELRKELSEFASVSEMDKKIDVIGENVGKVGGSVEGIDSALKDMVESKESTVIIKKLDDILVSIADNEVVPKKLEDLQNYIAEFSGVQDRVQDLANQFEETKEIVGIIVRQLDDIERKYNVAIDRVTEAVETIMDFVSSQPATEREPSKTDKKQAKESKEEEAPKAKAPDKGSLPSTIDALMDNLMTLVIPQTEATEMAEALEDVRDELTTMIKGHTPVLFQFGKRARELKSYPPTATLNENDIASLSREIKAWKSKLKEVAASS